MYEAAQPADSLQSGYLVARELFNAQRYSESLVACEGALVSPAGGQYRAYLMLSKAMNEYYLGQFSSLERTVAEMEAMDLPDVVRCRWLMLKGRVLALQRNLAAFAVFSEAEQDFARLGIEQDQAWAQLSSARLALITGDVELAQEAAGRVTFSPYLPKSRLLQAEAHLAAGENASALEKVAAVDAGAFGTPDDVDLARSAYVRAACALQQDSLVEAGLYLGEARNRALEAKQRDFELLNSIEKLRTLLESKGG